MARNARSRPAQHNHSYQPPLAHPSWRLSGNGRTPDGKRQPLKPADFWAKLGI